MERTIMKMMLILTVGILLVCALYVRPNQRPNIYVHHQTIDLHQITQEVHPVVRIPSRDILQQMSHADVHKFYHSYVVSPQITCSSVELMGELTWGAYEYCNDTRFAIDPSNCLVYSYGIQNLFSFDDDMATLGCEVHSFDPSMNTASHLRGERVHFHNTGVAGTDMFDDKKKWQLYSIATERKNLNHTPGQRRLDILKIDTEGAELESLKAALDAGALDDVRQLYFESHVAWDRNKDPSKEDYLKYLEMYRKIYDHGFRIYATHRVYQWSSFPSKLSRGRKRVLCHEAHAVNINHINPGWKEKHAQQLSKTQV